MPANQVQKGRIAEQKVVEHYLNRGFELVKRNFQYYGYNNPGAGRKGEIDIIVSKDKQLTLVEVKYRFDLAFGNVLEQITKKQLQNIYHSYLFFLTKPEGKIWQNCSVKLDIAVVVGNQIKILENATSFDSFW